MKRGLSHKRLGVQRSMLEKMGRSFVLSIQTPLEEADKYVFMSHTYNFTGRYELS